MPEQTRKPLVEQLLSARREAQRLNKELESAIELTGTQALVLIALSGTEGPSQRRLVDETGIDRSTLADVVKRLRTNGYLARRRSKADARAYIVTLTDEGRKAVARIKSVY